MPMDTTRNSASGTPRREPPGTATVHGSILKSGPESERGIVDALAADLIEQYLSLGLSDAQASRSFKELFSALGSVLAGIDSHALASVPLPEQVSILLPRFDIDTLARYLGIRTAQVQSALAMLVVEYLMRAHPMPDCSSAPP